MKKVLVLGAGLVTRPLVRYLLDEAGFAVTVASRTVSKAERLVDGHPNGKALPLLVTDQEALARLIGEHDLTVSLLPWQHHVTVAKLCIEKKKHMVTTSYVSAAMKELDGAAREAGISILNEIGVDPGIDHMSAMKIIHAVQKEGGRVVSFKSYCGGLPALEANTNPFGYKFSWSPMGVLLAATNDGRIRVDGEQVEIPGAELFDRYELVDIEGAGTYETYVNRDALPYLEIYGIEDAHTMSRWTLRNISHCETWKRMIDLGLFAREEMELAGMTYAGLIRKLTGAAEGADLEAAVRAKIGLPACSVITRKLRWLGFFDEEAIPMERGAPLDVVAHLMLERLVYAEDEADLIVLHHDFLAEFGDRRERLTSTLVTTGEPGGESAMSRTVSLPAAIGVRLILEGKIERRGVFIPVTPEIYEPVMAELETLGIVCKEGRGPVA